MSSLQWRIVAIVVCLVWIIVLISNNYINVIRNAPTDVIVIDNIFYSIPMILTVLLIIYPKQFLLYAILCCFLGIDDIIEGNGTNGLLVYFLGCAFAYKANLFDKHKFYVVLAVFLPIVSIFLQYRLGAALVVDTFLDLFFLLLISFLFNALFNEKLVSKIKTSDKRDLSVLKPTELEVLQEVLANKTYSTIGIEKNKSESSIKLVMQQICNKLNVKSKKELMDLHENNMLLLPEDS